MTYTITSVEDVGDDVLLVVALDADGNEITANGWVSATTNPKKMTPAQVGAYALSLLPVPPEAVPVKAIDFVAPT